MAYQYVWIIVVISFLVVVLMNVLSRRDMRGSSNHKKKDNSVEAGGQDAKVSVELFADREADAQETLALIKNVGGEAIAVQGDMTKAAAVKKC